MTQTRPPQLIASTIGGMMALATALGIGRFVYTPILPGMLDALLWTTTDAGLVASANFLGYLAGALVSSRPFMIERARTWLLTSLAISAVSTAAMAVPSGLSAFVVLRLIGGMASAIVIVCASTLVLERLSRSGATALSGVHFAGVGFGISMSAALVSLLAFLGFEWRAQWIGAGVLATIMAGVAATMIPRQKENARTTSPGDRVSKRGRLFALIGAHGLFGFGYVITSTFLVNIVRHSSETAAIEPWVWALVGLAAMPSVTVWWWLGKHIGALKAYAVGCLVEAVGVCASVEWITVSGSCVAAVLLGGTFMGITALGFIGAQKLSMRPQRAMGQITSSFALGQMIGPTLAGYLHEQFGSFRPPTLLAVGALLLAAMLAWCAELRPNVARIVADNRKNVTVPGGAQSPNRPCQRARR
jgi:predicted MFS family arabinose efflux permease